jgi:hypothetical protein
MFATFGLVLQASAQAQGSPGQGGTMLKPPPVSGQSYRVEAGVPDRSNYISGGILAGGGYIDNLFPGTTGGQVGETTFILHPDIAFDTESAHQHITASYSPNFMFYAPTSGLNEADQNFSSRFQYRFNPRLTMDVSDTLARSSSGFGQIGNGGISGGGQSSTSPILLPFGQRFMNNATGDLSYQFSLHGMIGASGNVGTLNYPKQSNSGGLYSSDARGGGGFYAHRLSAGQYLGAIYQYEQSHASPAAGDQYETDTHTIFGFYTIYLTESFSLSLSGGPQHYTESHPPFPSTEAWTPAATASLGWQNLHTSFAGYFSRTVSGGGGLLGAYNSTSGGASGDWRIAPLWHAGMNVNYSINKNAAPLVGLTSPSGHSFVASLSVGRALTTHSNLTLRYDRIQNKYDGIPSIDSNPSSDRVIMSYSWEFRRPLGR